MVRKIVFAFLVFLFFSLFTSSVKAEITKEDALKAIEIAEATIEQMRVAGFGLSYANDTLNEAKILFEQGHYMASYELAKKVVEIKERAVKVNELIDLVESRIYDLSSKGYDVSKASEMFSSGLEEFKNSNYFDAEEIMNQVLVVLDEIEAEQIIKKSSSNFLENFFVSVLDNLWLMILFALIILVIGGKTKEVLERKKRRKRMEELNREMEEIANKIKMLQKRYFEKGEISKTEYELAFDKFNKKLAEIKKEMSILQEAKK